MIRAFFVDFLLPLLFFLLARSFLRGFLSTTQRNRSSRRPEPESGPQSIQSGGELKRDPVCGTYVSTSGSLKRTVNGQVVHFCSPECRDRYQP